MYEIYYAIFLMRYCGKQCSEDAPQLCTDIITKTLNQTNVYLHSLAILYANYEMKQLYYICLRN